jgi:hypothetical protein
MFFRNEQAVLLFAVTVLFLFVCVCVCVCVSECVCVCVCVKERERDKKLLCLQMQRQTNLWWHILGNVARAIGTRNLNNETTKGLVKIFYRNLCDRSFPELAAKKAKLKKNRTTKSAELKTRKISYNHVWVLCAECHLVQTSIAFPVWVCILRPWVWTQVNKHTNLLFH